MLDHVPGKCCEGAKVKTNYGQCCDQSSSEEHSGCSSYHIAVVGSFGFLRILVSLPTSSSLQKSDPQKRGDGRSLWSSQQW